MALTANDLNLLAVQADVTAELNKKAVKTEVTAALAQKANISTTLQGYGIINGTLNEFTDASGGKNYIGKNIGTLSINSGTNIFANCTGTINYSGTSAKVYINNCPGLTINGKTISNWINIWIDGAASICSNNVMLTRDTAGFQTFAQNYLVANLTSSNSYSLYYPVAFVGDAAPAVTITDNTSKSSFHAASYRTYVQISANSTTSAVGVSSIGRWK